jgi:molybdate transport repressor ModE-like protein
VPVPDVLPDLVTLRILKAINDSGSLGQAASRVGMSQQAASSRVASAEDILGVLLVDRTRTGSTLSPHGQLVVEWSADVLDAADRLAVSLRTLGSGGARVLTVSASQTIAENFLPEWMAAFRVLTNGQSIGLTSGNSSFVIDRVRKGESAVGLIETPEAPEDLSWAKIRDDELVVVVSPLHPWAERASPLTAASHLAPTEPAAVLATTGAIRAAVISGVAPAVISVATVREDLARGRLRHVPIDDLVLVRPLTAVWKTGVQLPAVAETLFTVLRQASP